MDKKRYKLREDLSIEFNGIKLFRIEAVEDIDNFGVKKGDIGGYIEKEDNLSENAWVSDSAWVYGNAMVYGSALVSGSAEVYGASRVYGNARVYDNAEVFDRAKVYGNAAVFGRAEVFGVAWVAGDAKVYGNASVYDSAVVSKHAEVFGWARVYGGARVCGDVVKSEKDCVNITNEKYNITIMPEHLQIGCQYHSKKKWWGFSDSEILAMDGEPGLLWWKKWKSILMAVCEESEGEDE